MMMIGKTTKCSVSINKVAIIRNGSFPSKGVYVCGLPFLSSSSIHLSSIVRRLSILIPVHPCKRLHFCCFCSRDSQDRQMRENAKLRQTKRTGERGQTYLRAWGGRSDQQSIRSRHRLSQAFEDGVRRRNRREREERTPSPSVHLFLEEKAEEENEMPAHVRQTINESSCGKRECRERKEGEEKYVTLLVDEYLSVAPFNHLPVDSSSSSLRLNMNRREGRLSREYKTFSPISYATIGVYSRKWGWNVNPYGYKGHNKTAMDDTMMLMTQEEKSVGWSETAEHCIHLCLI